MCFGTCLIYLSGSPHGLVCLMHRCAVGKSVFAFTLEALYPIFQGFPLLCFLIVCSFRFYFLLYVTGNGRILSPMEGSYLSCYVAALTAFFLKVGRVVLAILALLVISNRFDRLSSGAFPGLPRFTLKMEFQQKQ